VIMFVCVCACVCSSVHACACVHVVVCVCVYHHLLVSGTYALFLGPPVSFVRRLYISLCLCQALIHFKALIHCF